VFIISYAGQWALSLHYIVMYNHKSITYQIDMRHILLWTGYELISHELNKGTISSLDTR